MKPRRLAMPHLAARVFGTPLAIEPGKLAVILNAIGSRVLGGEVLLDVEVDPATPQAILPKGQRSPSDTFTRLVEGVAILDVKGTLVHRSSWMDAASGLASYEQLDEELERAIANPNASAVLLAFGSPGGEVSGMFEMAERIQMLRGKTSKKVYALAADTCCSAAYLLAAACEKVYATEGAVTGSIGIVYAHMDVSEADKKAGIKITHVHAGAHKVDGNPHEPLSDDAKATLQAHVDKTAAIFFARVDKFRGLKPGASKALEAAIYIGAEAKDVGLIDGIKSTRQVLDELRGAGRSATFGGPGAAATTPVRPASTGAKHMDLEQALAALSAMTKERDELSAKLGSAEKELAKASAKLEAADLSLKSTVIEKHIKAGVPAVMRKTAEKLAPSMTAEELDAEMGSWAKVTHPKPLGTAAGAEEVEEKKPIEVLNAKANEIKAANPKLSFPDAFEQACRSMPEAYANYRASTRIVKKGA